MPRNNFPHGYDESEYHKVALDAFFRAKDEGDKKPVIYTNETKLYLEEDETPTSFCAQIKDTFKKMIHFFKKE